MKNHQDTPAIVGVWKILFGFGFSALFGGLVALAVANHARTLSEHEPYCPHLEEPEPERTALV